MKLNNSICLARLYHLHHRSKGSKWFQGQCCNADTFQMVNVSIHFYACYRKRRRSALDADGPRHFARHKTKTHAKFRTCILKISNQNKTNKNHTKYCRNGCFLIKSNAIHIYSAYIKEANMHMCGIMNMYIHINGVFKGSKEQNRMEEKQDIRYD